MGGLAEMQYFVNCQSSRLAKPFSTVIALEWLVFGMYVFVVPQMILSPEGFSTNVTGKRPLICVGSLVDQQIVAFREFPVAKLADEPFLGPAAPTDPCVEPGIYARCRCRGVVGRGLESGCLAQPMSHQQGL